MTATRKAAGETVLNMPGLVCFWDFQESEGEQVISRGKERYKLAPMNGPIRRSEEGIFGPYSTEIRSGQWYNIPRTDCPALDFHGETAFTVCAWIKRSGVESGKCEAVAGMWNETEKQRQYCMFLNLRIWKSAQQLCGHVSAEGGPTPGYPYCMTTAIGESAVPFEQWRFAVFTYDGEFAKVYLDGKLDEREEYNPYPYPKPLYDGGSSGADFTVAAVDRSGEMGNFYEGLLGGLAIYNCSLSEQDISLLYQATLGNR